MQRAEPPPSLPSVGLPASSSGGGWAEMELGRELRRGGWGRPVALEGERRGRVFCFHENPLTVAMRHSFDSPVPPVRETGGI